MTEQIMNRDPVSKPTQDEEEKTAIGQKLGAITRRYPNSRRLREAGIILTVKIFEKLSKGSSRGNIVELEGTVEYCTWRRLHGRRFHYALKEVIPYGVQMPL